MSSQKFINNIRARLSSISEKIIQSRNKRFDEGIGVVNIPIPVISVGNITTGGTGKTPYIELLIREIYALFPLRKIAVVSRGYRRKSSGVIVVSDGNSSQPIASLEQSGDELYMIAKLHPEVVVIASEKRIHGAELAYQKYDAECVILDDGFQHRMIHRDLDIVLVDPVTLNEKYCIPFGHLREPKENLRRAQILCGVSGIGIEQMKKLSDCNHTYVSAENKHSGWYDISMLHQVPKPTMNCFAITAIARPERFFTSLQKQEIQIAGSKVFSDHHWYSADDCTSIIDYVRTCLRNTPELLTSTKGGDVKTSVIATIITTAKDAVKLEAYQSLFTDVGIEVVVSSIQTSIISGREYLHGSLQKVLTT
jgi:tetraacyldisaccharide 4'-kinase